MFFNILLARCSIKGSERGEMKNAKINILNSASQSKPREATQGSRKDKRSSRRFLVFNASKCHFI